MNRASLGYNILGLGLAFTLLLSPKANANLIQNGNFETGSLSSWGTSGNVATASVPFFGEGTTAANGTTIAVFNAGNAPPNGVLSQSFAAVAGTQYSLTYDYGSNAGVVQSITAAIKNGATTVASQFTSSTGTQGPLATFTLSFFATASTALTLSFTDYGSNPTNNTDGALDNVTLNAVPEPSSLALLAMGALFCVTGLRARRNRSLRG